MSYLLDTSVVSELRRPRPDPGVVRWIEQADAGQLYLSVLTLGELRQGVERLRRTDARRADAIAEWTAGLVQRFNRRIAGIDAAIALRWGDLNARHRVPVVDGLLAATALERGWTLVTRNVADVRRTGVAVVNPFEG